MTVVIEVSRPFQARPGKHVSDSMYRVWWLWFSVAILRVSIRKFAETSYRWES